MQGVTAVTFKWDDAACLGEPIGSVLQRPGECSGRVLLCSSVDTPPWGQ